VVVKFYEKDREGRLEISRNPVGCFLSLFLVILVEMLIMRQLIYVIGERVRIENRVCFSTTCQTLLALSCKATVTLWPINESL
jgi:hypothetical protein